MYVNLYIISWLYVYVHLDIYIYILVTIENWTMRCLAQVKVEYERTREGLRTRAEISPSLLDQRRVQNR